jgi:hypothetical protein
MARAFLSVIVFLGAMPLFSAAQDRPQNPFTGAGRNVPPPAPAAAPAAMKIRVEEDLVTAQIASTPLPVVLNELAARSGVVFEAPSDLVAPITIALYKVPLKEAIERISDTNNSIFYYSQAANGNSRVSFVRVFSRANKSQSQQVSLRYFGSGSITKTGDDSVDTPEQAMKVLAENGDVDLRQKAIEILARGKTDAAMDAIAKALGDSAPEVRAAAIEALAGNGVRTALPQILAALKDQHPGVRQSAIVAVALIGDTENVRQLQPLTRDKDASVAAAAEMAVRKLAMRRP